MKRPPHDPALLRDRLAIEQGKQYWRSLEELAGDPAVVAMLQREFPDRAGEWTDPISRRRFLALMGASLTLAGMAGCTRPPTGTIMPYVRQPANIVLGKPLYYATSMPLAGFATGLLVESHEGRPTKIEGNPQHHASLGATSVYHQAAILGLYDPDRARAVTFRGQPRNWGDVVEELRNRLHRTTLGDGKDKSAGKGLAFLTETAGSPTLNAQFTEFLGHYPAAKWYSYEPINRDNALAGARLAFGKEYHSYPRVAKADVIVALDADFLAQGPAHLVNTRDFSSRRREAGGKQGMNRLYAIETDLTITGARADHRLALKPTQIEAFARALAERLGVAGATGKMEGETAARWIEVVAKDLQSRKPGTTLVLAGDGQPPAVHAIVAAINQKLGNIGSTAIYTDPPLPVRADSMTSLEQLVSDIERGDVDTLIVLGGNPAYTAPAELHLDDVLARRLARQPREKWLAVHLGPYFDETSRLCHWHIPEAHFLESWSDGIAFDGTASIVQPLIAPLYAGKSVHEVLAALTRRNKKEGTEPGSDYDDRTAYEVVRDYWKDHRPGKTAKEPFERFWQRALHDGFVDGTALPPAKVTLAANLFAKKEMAPAAAGDGKGYELVLAPDPAVFDGRFANNGWLQEFARPITRITWDNAVLMSPATAAKLQVRDTIGNWRAGEHGQSFADMVLLQHGRRTVEAAIWVVPGHADDALTLYLGYGRTHAGRVGTGVGFNANRLRLPSMPWILTGVNVSRRGKQHTIACVQAHHSMEGRDIVRSGTQAEYQEDQHFAQKHEHVGEGGHLKQEDGKRRKELPTLYSQEHAYDGKYRWGMAIDLSACTGCGACVVACQAENNSPIVGKEQVTRGREMHWLRIDRYFETPAGAARQATPTDPLYVHFQPMLCQHCENAPCEVVCPVEATAHGEEGTNDMVYNRCVGTRYCANNCPYKVRRFNYLQFADYETPSLKLMYNPDVTLRSRGVMEKCTFCIQRISYARIEASKEALDNKKRLDPERPGLAKIHDGEVVTACQAACPAEAIIFGDLNDKSSRVHRLHESSLRYDVLGELGVRPRVGYLAALRNPNPELETA